MDTLYQSKEVQVDNSEELNVKRIENSKTYMKLSGWVYVMNFRLLDS